MNMACGDLSFISVNDSISPIGMVDFQSFDL